MKFIHAVICSYILFVLVAFRIQLYGYTTIQVSVLFLMFIYVASHLGYYEHSYASLDEYITGNEVAGSWDVHMFSCTEVANQFSKLVTPVSVATCHV